MLISVDLPQPFGPKMETIFPLGMSKLKSLYRTAPPKDLSKPRIVTCVPAWAGRSKTVFMLCHSNEQFVFQLIKRLNLIHNPVLP